MNTRTRQNRAKRIRLAQEKQGSAAIRLKPDVTVTGFNYKTIESMANDKTPKTQRTGNYYEQVTKKVNKTIYTSIKPVHKIRAKQIKDHKPSTSFFDAIATLKRFFGVSIAKA